MLITRSVPQAAVFGCPPLPLGRPVIAAVGGTAAPAVPATARAPTVRRHRHSAPVVAQSHTNTGPSPASSGTTLTVELNSVCNAALQAMLANDSQRVPELEQRIEGLRRRALERDHDLEVRDFSPPSLEVAAHVLASRKAVSACGLTSW